MIIVRDIIETVLYDLKETYARKHSDEELISAINVILRYINVALANKEVPCILKECTLKPKDGVARLPQDFLKFGSFEKEYRDDYKIQGHKIHVTREVDIDYYYVIPKVEHIDDEIDLPYFLFDLVVRLTEGNLTDTLTKDGMGQLINAEVNKLLASGGPIDRPLAYFV